MSTEPATIDAANGSALSRDTGSHLKPWPWLYAVLKVIARFLCWVYFRLRGAGEEHVPATGPLIVVCNHRSVLDPIILGAAFPRPIRYVAKAELFQNSFMRALMRRGGAISVNRTIHDSQAARESLQALRDGSVLGIFPEGTRTRQPGAEMLPFKVGAVNFALRGKVPMVPAAIVGSELAMRPGSHFPQMVPVRVLIGPPVDLSDLYAKARSPESLDEGVRRIRTAIQELIDQLEKSEV